MSSKHHAQVEKQFGEQAGAYLTSAVHAGGDDLVKLAACLSRLPGCRLLDLGCGAGHASFVAAQHAREVIAYDLSDKMLQVVRQTAAERGYDHLSTRQGYAEQLPFAEGEFDVVISRYSAHHWHDVGSALREARRVVKPGGKVIMMDVSSPGNAPLGIWLQTIEALRDTSHVHNYSPGEWLTLLTEAGLRIDALSQGRLDLEFSSWIARMRTPDALVSAIRLYQQSAAEEVQRYYALQADGSFTTDTVFIEATRP